MSTGLALCIFGHDRPAWSRAATADRNRLCHRGPGGDWWIAEFYWDHPQHLVYVNIGTPPEWKGDRMTQIDLDLDVVRNVDGSVEVLDEDEFADHQVRYGYPQEMIDRALSATELAVELLQRGAGPFGVAPARWMKLAGHG